MFGALRYVTYSTAQRAFGIGVLFRYFSTHPTPANSSANRGALWVGIYPDMRGEAARPFEGLLTLQTSKLLDEVRIRPILHPLETFQHVSLGIYD